MTKEESRSISFYVEKAYGEALFLLDIHTKYKDQPSPLPSDGVLRRAVEKAVENIGESVYKVLKSDAGFKVRYSDVSWEDIAGMRHIIVHEYWSTDLKILWSVVTRYIPDLVVSLRLILVAEGLLEEPGVGDKG